MRSGGGTTTQGGASNAPPADKVRGRPKETANERVSTDRSKPVALKLVLCTMAEVD
jgi:hypothetical protein